MTDTGTHEAFPSMILSDPLNANAILVINDEAKMWWFICSASYKVCPRFYRSMFCYGHNLKN